MELEHTQNCYMHYVCMYTYVHVGLTKPVSYKEFQCVGSAAFTWMIMNCNYVV